MADFTVKKRKAFTVKIEGVRDEFKIPALSSLNIETINSFNGITADADLLDQARMVKEFLREACPELVDKASDYELIEIFNAYFEHQGSNSGES